MVRAKVVDCANQIHRGVQGRCLACQSPPSPYQGRDARAEGGIQPFDVGGFDLLDPPGRDLIQVPDHPPDLDPLRTRQAVLAVVDKNDTSPWSLWRAFCSIPKETQSLVQAQHSV
jgi:hypothetical protein